MGGEPETHDGEPAKGHLPGGKIPPPSRAGTDVIASFEAGASPIHFFRLLCPSGMRIASLSGRVSDTKSMKREDSTRTRPGTAGNPYAAAAARTARANFLTGALLAAAAAAAGVSLPAAAMTDDGLQSPETIREAARRFALAQFGGAPPGMRIEIEAEDLDPRLRLPACPRPLETQLAPGSKLAARFTVGVRCRGASPWQLYVPMRARLIGTVVSVPRALPAGRVLGPDDLRVERRDLLAQPGMPLTDPSQAIGQRLRYALAAGTVLTPSMLTAPKSVRRGETVTILAEQGALRVRAQGVALADGAVGERIRVRNVLTKKVIQATVADEGLVRVPL